jgi:hypothetical protein
VGRAATAEQLEESLQVERADARSLELQQVVLARVDVDRQHVRALQGVVEHVAARAGDRQHALARRQAQRLAVQRRVLPALVVDELAAVDGAEQAARESGGRGEAGDAHDAILLSADGNRLHAT